MNPEYNPYNGNGYEINGNSNENNGNGYEMNGEHKPFWKTKYFKLLHKYYALLNHCGVYFNYGDNDEDDNRKQNNNNNDLVSLLKNKNNHLTKTIAELDRIIKYKLPIGPPLHPVNDMSMNAPRYPRVIQLYAHPDYHKHRDVSMNPIPHHIYPHPIPIPTHPPMRPVMPQHAHIPPTKPNPPINKGIYDGYPYYYGYPYYGNNYPYYYGCPYYNSIFPYYRDIDDHHHNNKHHRNIPNPPPYHPVLHHNM